MLRKQRYFRLRRPELAAPAVCFRHRQMRYPGKIDPAVRPPIRHIHSTITVLDVDYLDYH